MPSTKAPEKDIIYFIIVCYNNEDLIDSCISSIQKQTYKNWKIVVVDNGSADKSVDHIKKNYPFVTLIETGKNEGFAIGNNIGIKEAAKDPKCGFVALLNTDATIDPNWTTTILSFAQQNKGASFQTPTLDYYDHKILDSRGITIDPEGRARQLGYREKYNQRDSHVIFGVNAAACIYNMEFLKEQPFDEDYFDSDLWMYLEDADLAARATVTGWKNWYVDGSFAYHMGSASSGKNPGFSVRLIYRNNYPMLLKNLPISMLPYATLAALTTDIHTLFQLLRGKNKTAIKALLKGRFQGLTMIPLFLKKRRAVQVLRKIDTKELRKLMTAK